MPKSHLARPTALSGLILAAMIGLAPQTAAGQERYIGEIIYSGTNFCPRGTLSADGQILSIAQYTALFSLFGTTYGGDGRTSFALPDLRGRAPVGDGNGPGLPNVRLGEKNGAQSIVLTESNLPPHSHTVNANNLDGDRPGPGGKLLAAAPTGGTGNETIYSTAPPTVQMSAEMIAPSGGGTSFNIEDPHQVITFCVVLEGLYPSRS
ncbi:MAG: tail fiber protein [Pseudomonadota bacterium]